jgi:polysaccharide biosynthesis protein PelD
MNAPRKRGFLGVRTPRSWLSAWLESGLLALLVPLVGFWISRRDPLFVRAAFPWSVMAPLIAGVRYGFAAGFGCATLIIFIMMGAWQNELPLPFPAEELPLQLGIGLLIVGMVAGEFSDLWKRRLQTLETEEGQLRRRFDGFARTYQALRVSHDLLESRVVGLTTTVREGLRALSEESFPRGDAPATAQQILELFATHCEVRVGAVYLCDDTGNLPGLPTARLGEIAPALAHPLIAEALRRNAVASAGGFGPGAAAAPARGSGKIGDPASDDGAASADLLVVAPFVDLDDRVRGLLVVADMPFMAFGPETLRRIAVLAGRLGDLLGADRDARGADRAAVASFIGALYRSLRERRAHGLLAGVVRFVVAARADAAVTRLLCGARRTTDRALATGGAAGGTNVTVLLPLTDEIGLARYLARVEAQVRARTGASLGDSGVEVVYRASIDDQSGDQLLRDLQLPAAPAVLDPKLDGDVNDDARARDHARG